MGFTEAIGSRVVPELWHQLSHLATMLFLSIAKSASKINIHRWIAVKITNIWIDEWFKA